MIRSPLKSGEMIRLGHRDYTIKSILGDGATCIVYSADYEDSTGNSHDVNIKECYPYNADIVRNGQILVWASKEEQSVRLSAFGTAYEKLMSTQNGNFSVHAFDICEANGTQYIIMDRNDGKTFDKTPSAPLTDVLKTIRLLTYVVGSYHDRGYLHLDIKPSNFLVYSRPSEHIVLFDMDTVTPIEEIRKGNFNVTSYSDRWAAPEQKRCQLAKLCPATDIFAIGATLFEKIMGRAVTAADMGVFSNWDFDDDLFKDVNPKIKRLLRNIFKKTLSANIKRRYQETSELLADLDEAIEAAESKVYLLSNCPALTAQFIGREFEIRKIRQSFESKKRAIFLSGEGGIGKSLLAQAYAKQYREEYDAVLFYRYKDSLESLVDAIEIQNFDSNEGSKQTSLRRLLNERVLLIVDNFDVETTEERFLNEFLRYEAHILFTTRTDFSILNGGEVKQFVVTQLPESQLSQLFSRASGHTITESEIPVLHKLLKSVDFNTYATELLGAQMRASDYSLEALVKEVSPGLDALAYSERVLVNKDDYPSRERIPKIIRELFRVADLSEVRKQVLRNMYLLRFLEIDRPQYREFTHCDISERDALNELLELRWVRKNGAYFTLHPLVEEIVKSDLNPNEENCGGIYTTIVSHINFCCECRGHTPADDYKFDNTCKLLCAFFDNAPLEQDSTRFLLYVFLVGIVNNPTRRLGRSTASYFSKIYKVLEEMSLSLDISPFEKTRMRCILLASCIDEFAGSHMLYHEDPMVEEHLREKEELQRVENLLRAFSLAVDAANALGPSDREKVLDEIYTLVLSNTHMLYSEDKLNALIHQLYEERPDICSIDARTKKRSGLPLNEKEQEEVDTWEKAFDKMMREYRESSPKAAYDRYSICVENFRKAANKADALKQIVGDTSISIEDRAVIASYCTHLDLNPFYLPELMPAEYAPVLAAEIDWNAREKALLVEKEFLLSPECRSIINKSAGYLLTGAGAHKNYIDRWKNFVYLNNINLLLVSALLGNEARFDACFMELFEDLRHRISINFRDNNDKWLEFINPLCPQNSPFPYAVNALVRLGKANWLLPYLIQFATGWEDYAQKNGYIRNENFVPLYQAIVDCAVAANLEEDVIQKKQALSEIQAQYQRKLDVAAGISFSLRPKED